MRNYLLAIIVFLALLGCKEEKKVERVAIQMPDTQFEVFDTVQLSAKVYYSDGSMDSSAVINWKTSDSIVLKINPTGIINGLRTGSATITAEYAGVSAQLALVVNENSKTLLLKGWWELISAEDIKNKQLIEYPASITKKIIVCFNDSLTNFSFSGVCNYGGEKCIIDPNKLSFPNGIFSTRLDCINSEWEDYLLKSFKNMNGYIVNDIELHIFSYDLYNLNLKKVTKTK